MLILDLRAIGNKMLARRKMTGLTQAELAERAGISDRAYAEIERGNVNLRVETLLQICRALNITPDALLTEDDTSELLRDDVLAQLERSSPRTQETALRLLDLYLKSN